MTRWSYFPRRGNTTGSGKKYGNRKVATEDGTFDSVKEARRNAELQLLAAAGEIHDLRRQVHFELIPQQREPDTIGPRGGVIKGKVLEKACEYIADFCYIDADGKKIVEDTKGFRTKDYVIKRKLMLYVHGIRIREL